MAKSVVELFKESLVGKSELTIKTYENEILHFQSFLEKTGGSLENITRVDVQSYIDQLQNENKSVNTINKKFKSIVSFAQFMNRPEVVKNIRVPKVNDKAVAPKSLNEKEKRKTLREIERKLHTLKGGQTRKNGLRDIALVYLALYSGLRVSELNSLNREDIQLGERSGSVLVRQGKGNKVRKVPLIKEVRYWLNKYLESREDELEALFLSTYQKRMSTRSIQRVFEKLGLHSHMARHTFISELVRAGMDIVSVQALTGHESLEMVARYSKPTYEELEKDMERLLK